jgi:hypothetical protein
VLVLKAETREGKARAWPEIRRPSRAKRFSKRAIAQDRKGSSCDSPLRPAVGTCLHMKSAESCRVHGQSLNVSAQSSPGLPNELIAPALRPAYWSVTLDFLLADSKKAMRRGSTPQSAEKGSPNKTVVAKAAHILAAAGETAKAPSFSAYVRLFELARDYDREFTVTRAERPHNQTEIVECREPLARPLRAAPPDHHAGRRRQGLPRFDLSALSDSALAFLRRAVLKPRWWATHGEIFGAPISTPRSSGSPRCRERPMVAGPSLTCYRPPGDRGAPREGITLFCI